ncbi:hypothetical protein CRG98_023943 [Punica granatum]|uniref:Uncharacterized protein n=1 Tax=Punica granatum TaxID=22663 RepID=A0A2I0JHB5_PUNGR|nr:hypothetical protein CRG98_023943 [Punica granatum]
MTFRCPDSYGVSLMSHAGSTTYFPARVMRQLGGLQTVPEDTARTRFEHTWWEDQTPVDRQSNVEQVLNVWRTVITERPYFPEHPTQDERDFQATEEYILRFYRWGPSENDDFTDSPPIESSTSSGAPVPDTAIQVELANLRAERDRLRQEVAEKNEQLGDQHQLQKELAQARAQLQRRDQELAQASATLERPSPRTDAFHGDGRLHPEHVGRPT